MRSDDEMRAEAQRRAVSAAMSATAKDVGFIAENAARNFANGHSARHVGWEDALDVLVHLHDQIRSRRLLITGYRPEMGIRELREYETEYLDWDAADPLKMSREFGDHFLIQLLESIADADPVYVSDDVIDIWREASSEFTPEPLHPSEPFAPVALGVFARPTELSGSPFPLRALFWTKPLAIEEPESDEDWRGLTLPVYGFSRTEDLLEEPPAAIRGRWIMAQTFWLPVGYTVTEAQDYWHEMSAKLDEKLPERPAAHKTFDVDDWIDIQSFWRLARAFVPTQERPSRPFRRIVKRANLEQRDITVIRLRRQSHTAEEHHPVDWSCRWIVRGHWRRLETGRQVYVRPHVKGPDEMPLRVTHRAWEFTR
jgi:hypothetical protein